MPGITILGLGPGDPAKLTREAWDVLSSVDEVWLRTNQHPTIADSAIDIKNSKLR